MSWLTIVWSMAASACGTIAVVHVGIWLGRREQRAHLLFALGALAAAVNAFAELGMFTSTDVGGYAAALRLSLVAVAGIIGFMCWYGQVYYGNGREALLRATLVAWAAVALLAAVLPYGPIYARIEGLRFVETSWGERFAVADGVASPWRHALDLADLVLLVFLLDAAANAWRRGQRFRGIVSGVGFLALIGGSAVEARLVDAGQLRLPYLVTFVFMVIVFALGYPLTAEAVQVTSLARKLAETEAGLVEHRNELAHLSRVAVAGELSASLAHELNQPLAAILSNAQAGLRLLRREEPDREELGAILADVAHDSKRAGEVIRRLRHLLRKEPQKQDSLDVNELVGDAIKVLRNDLLVHGVALATDFAPELPTVLGDRIQLQQVVLNLVVNGIEAMAQMPMGERRIVVSTRRSGAGVTIAVSDSGPGIPPGSAEEVFTPFFTTKSSGMGLGLAVCRTIIDAHGGKIRVAEAKAGATLEVELPAVAPAAAPA